MARKARQGSRLKKKQTRVRTPPVASTERPEPIVEPTAAPGAASEPTAGTTSRGVPTGAQSPRSTMTRAAKPYQHRRGRQVAIVRSSSAANTYVLPREEEYGFIRSDLRRLLLTAAVLAIMMVALLVILEP